MCQHRSAPAGPCRAPHVAPEPDVRDRSTPIAYQLLADGNRTWWPDRDRGAVAAVAAMSRVDGAERGALSWAPMMRAIVSVFFLVACGSHSAPSSKPGAAGSEGIYAGDVDRKAD